MRCHNIRDPEIGRVHIPGCMGCAVYGHHACTCEPSPKRTQQEIEVEIEEMKARIARLETALATGSRTAGDRDAARD